MNPTDYEAYLLGIPYEKEDPYNSLSMPIYNSVAFEFSSAEEMEAAFCGLTAEHTYSRITNPTVQYYESRIQALTGALSVTAMSSGMAAIANVFLTVAEAGTNIITSNHLFGNTYSLLNSTLRSFGVEPYFCDLTSEDDVRKRIDENTCAIFLEVITNPQLEVADLRMLSEIAMDAGIPLIVDTTLVPLHTFRASELGVDIEVLSSTKYISGGAAGLGGLIIDHGRYDWSQSNKLSALHKEFGEKTFTAKLRKEIHRNLGAYMTPQVAYMQTVGLETMAVRYERQVTTGLELARRLRKLPQIKEINHLGLESNKFFQIARRQFTKSLGAMFTFDLASREDCFRFMNNLKVIHRSTNLFENKTLAIHPASTIYGSFSESRCIGMGVGQNTIRLSVGLEGTEVIYNDIVQALEGIE